VQRDWTEKDWLDTLSQESAKVKGSSTSLGAAFEELSLEEKAPDRILFYTDGYENTTPRLAPTLVGLRSKHEHLPESSFCV